MVDIPLRLHHPMWVQNDGIDFDYHLRPVDVPAPGLAGGRVAVIHEVHHLLADGMASANQMA